MGWVVWAWLAGWLNKAPAWRYLPSLGQYGILWARLLRGCTRGLRAAEGCRNRVDALICGQCMHFEYLSCRVESYVCGTAQCVVGRSRKSRARWWLHCYPGMLTSCNQAYVVSCVCPAWTRVWGQWESGCVVCWSRCDLYSAGAVSCKLSPPIVSQGGLQSGLWEG